MIEGSIDLFVPKPYAPWIQLFLDNDLERPYVTYATHEYLLLPVHGPPTPSTDKVKGIVGTAQQIPVPEAPAHELPFHRRSSLGIGPEYYTSDTDPSIIRGRANPEPPST